MSIRILISLICIFSISGCSTKVTRPDPISFEVGLAQVVKGLNSLEKLTSESNNALVPSELELQFQLSTTSKEKGNETLQILPGNIIKEITGLSGTFESEVTEVSGNTVKIKFRSLLFANKNELIAQGSDSVKKAIEKAKEVGVKVLIDQPVLR